MRLEILGPRVGCSAYLVTGDTATVLLDCGPGTRGALEERQLLGRLDAIVISHMHLDHMLDLVVLAMDRHTRGLYPTSSPWPRTQLLLPREDGEDTLRGIATAVKGNYWPRVMAAFAMVPYGAGDRFEVGDLRLTFAATKHGVPSYAMRIVDGAGALTYTGDSAPCPSLYELAAGADLLVGEATFTEDEGNPRMRERHMSGSDAGRLATEADVGRLVLTHLPPDDALAERNLADARAAFHGPVELARVGLRCEV